MKSTVHRLTDSLKTRAAMRPQANKILQTILSEPSLHTALTDKKQLNIIVPCAGDFPSFVSFIKSIFCYAKQLQALKLVLIDPDQAQVRFFTQHIFQQEKNFLPAEIQIQMTHFNGSLFHFLQQAGPVVLYDMIYFEHPIISAGNQLLEALMGGEGESDLSSSFPLLSTVLKDDAIILTVCKTVEETQQAKRLLAYCYNIEGNILSLYPLMTYVFPSDFSNGYAARLRFHHKANLTPEKSANIEISGNELLRSFMAAVLIHISPLLINSKSSIVDFILHSFSLMAALLQIALHQPGNTGRQIKIALISFQIGINLLVAFGSHTLLQAWLENGVEGGENRPRAF